MIREIPDGPVPILILGTRPYSEVLMDMFECLSNKICFIGAVENMNRERCNSTLAGLPIYWHSEIAELTKNHRLVCALGTTLRDTWINECKKMGFSFEMLVHPSSLISSRTDMGEGVIVDAGCVVAGFSSISEHVRIGRRVSIGHHTRIGPYSTVHPGAIISGNCAIGSQVTLGSGSIIIDGISIGDGAVIAAGTVVNKDIPPNVLAAGNPVEIKRQNYGPR